ncbi:MAG: DUF4340 domain-containing protein [Bacteroidales bacterium]|nr:DUF4340 domain-containing protein [Bacteroidales bacterium]MCF6341587.1 DUF4340 domain-containing protein [Bacteroidales bacterium]
MKKNRPLIFILLFLAVVAVFLVSRNNSSTLQEKETGFAIADTSAVTRIFIADKKDHTVLLERSGNGWLLNGKFPTSTRMVEILLETMHDIKVRAPVSLSSHDNIVSRMAVIGIKVEVYEMVYRINLFDKIKLFRHEALTKVFYVGDATQNNRGTYMLMEGAERPYITYLPSLRGFITTRFSALEDDWKSHAVFNNKLIDIQSLSLIFAEGPENSFKVEVNDARGNYKLTAIQDNRSVTNYDTLKVLNLLTSFADLRYETRLNSILQPETIDSIVASPFLYEITLEDRRQGTRYVRAFRRAATPDGLSDGEGGLIPVDHDRFYALINDGEDFVLMQYFVFDRVLKPLSYYEK